MYRWLCTALVSVQMRVQRTLRLYGLYNRAIPYTTWQSPVLAIELTHDNDNRPSKRRGQLGLPRSCQRGRERDVRLGTRLRRRRQPSHRAGARSLFDPPVEVLQTRVAE